MLSHAVIIEGEKGVGKRELALWLAKALLCKAKNPPCGVCSVCKKISAGNHPDVELFDGSGAARSFHIESIRDIKESLWLAPNESDVKIYVLLEIQNMTAEAQNALLKSLEEPPEHARFIMTCQNIGMLLDTVISRSTVYKLEPFSDGCPLSFLRQKRRSLSVPQRTMTFCQALSGRHRTKPPSANI